jgi:enoyl-[acyl-carrier protein] reductase I
MDLFVGKTGIIMGVANKRSIATGIAQCLHEHQAKLAISYLPTDNGRMEKRVRQAVDPFEPKLVVPCDITSDQNINDCFAQVKEHCGKIDFLVHSIANAPLEDIRCPTLNTSRKGFLQAMETSVYSFIAVAREAAKIMNPGGSILTMSYFGGEKVVAGYNLMGVAKAALESSIKYLAFDLGPQNIRVNGISAGAIKTLAASAVGDFGDMLGMSSAIAPLQRNTSTIEVGNTALYLLSNLSSGTTGEIIHVDCGYHMMGSPGRALETWKLRPRDTISNK